MLTLANLPTSIEAALIEAGFSGTEILVLKRLLESDALTLRELAGKTGKSTGVLDQSLKKLSKKKIVTEERINGTTKYSIASLQAVVKWMEEDTHSKREELLRRHQNFESFIASLEVDKHRPDMEFFEGRERIQQAYMRLLQLGKEMLMYVPVVYAVEDDPLHDFLVEYFRERRNRSIFSRVITFNTPLGRRYQSRDPFEYRKTLLVPEKEFPLAFEKIIIGDTVACMNHAKNQACFIRYPELASTERALFEAIWKNGEIPRGEMSLAPEPAENVTSVPLGVRILSGVREFFLSRKSLMIFAIFGVFSALLTYGAYGYTANVNFQRMQDKVVAIATTGAMEINLHDLDQLQVQEDYKKPEWAKITNILKNIRTQNTDIMYVYIFRKSKTNPEGLNVISDSHSLNPFANVDTDPTNDVDMNADGKIDGSPTGGDYLAWPGQPYPTPPKAAFKSFDGLRTSQFYEDQYGKVVSGYAPLKDTSGATVAVLAVDMNAKDLNKLTLTSFSPLLYFLGIFILFVLIRLAAFNRSLFS